MGIRMTQLQTVSTLHGEYVYPAERVFTFLFFSSPYLRKKNLIKSLFLMLYLMTQAKPCISQAVPMQGPAVAAGSTGMKSQVFRHCAH